MAGSPVTVTPPTARALVRARARCAHRRGAGRVGSRVARAGDDRTRARAPALGRAGGRRRRVPRRSARTDAVERPRRRRGEGRTAGRRGHALGRVVVLRLPARQARRRARPQVARRARRARRAARARRHPPPQPAHARGAPARPRRGDGARGEPRHRLLPRQLVRTAGRARRLARLRPALPVVVRLGGRRRRRGQRPDVAPARLHGPHVRDGVADLHAARAVPPRPHRRDAVRRRLAARRRRDDRAARPTSTRTARSCRSRCSTTSRPASRPGTASPRSPTAGSRSRRPPTRSAPRSTALGGVDALVKGTVADALAALADAGVPSSAGAARPGRAVLLVGRQRRRGPDRALRARRLRTASSSRARSGSSATST